MHWIVWIFTVIIVLISTLFLVGLMAGRQNVGPSLRGTGPEDADMKVPPVGTNFELPTFTHFFLAVMDGNMPGNVKSQLPLFSKEGMDLFTKKYSEWAPPPWDKLPAPAGPFGNMPGGSPPAIIRINIVMSGMDDLMQSLFRMTLTVPKEIDLSFRSMKTRMWFGMPPVSAARWKAKGLDEKENIEEALAIIEQVISVYKYLATPEIQGDIRWIYNKIWAEIDVFQDAVNGLATSRNEPAPPYHLTKLWEEYMAKLLVHMDNQSRAFVFGHLKKLDEVWKRQFLECFQSGREINDTHMTVKIDHNAMMIRNKIFDLYRDADIYMHHRHEGYFQNGGIHKAFYKDHGDKEKCVQIYAQIENQRVAVMEAMIQNTINNRVAQRRSSGPIPNFMEAPSLLTDREFGHKSIQPEIEYPPQLVMEGWVHKLMLENVERFGFVVYRLDYTQPDVDWEKTKEFIEERLDSGLEGVIGAEQVRNKATLHWIDGREEKILEGDIEAARNDFKIIISLESFPTGLQKDVFLAITPQSLKSFLPPNSNSNSPSAPSPTLTGDFGPFLIAAAADPKPDLDLNPPLNPSNSQPSSSRLQLPPPAEKTWTDNYPGHFPILDQLIWTDLYAMRGYGPRQLEECWALGARHPWGVYVGPTTAVRRRKWREMGMGMSVLVSGAKRRG